MPMGDVVLEAEVDFRDRSIRMCDLMDGPPLVWFHQFAGIVCVGTRYKKAPDFAGYVSDCLSEE